MSTFSPVFSSSSVWNFSIGCDWFSVSQRAFKLRLVRAKGRCCNLHQKVTAQVWLQQTRASPLQPSPHQRAQAPPRAAPERKGGALKAAKGTALLSLKERLAKHARPHTDALTVEEAPLPLLSPHTASLLRIRELEPGSSRDI